jgi:hypothetical protein
MLNFKSSYGIIAIVFFISFNMYGQHINNGFLRFGGVTGGVGNNSINISGNLEQPFYENGGFKKLTYSNYALDSKIAVGGDGTAEWNQNGTLKLNPVMSNQVIDQSNFTITGGTSSGTIIVRGDITIGSFNFELTNSYTLLDSEKFIKIETTLKNKGASSATNIRYWVGTRDDYTNGSDRPKKERGNIANSSFELITATTQRSKAIKISSADEGILFFYKLSNFKYCSRRLFLYKS